MRGNARSGTPLTAGMPVVEISLPRRILIWEDDGGYVHLRSNDARGIVRRPTQGAGPNQMVAPVQTARPDTSADAAEGKS